MTAIPPPFLTQRPLSFAATKDVHARTHTRTHTHTHTHCCGVFVHDVGCSYKVVLAGELALDSGGARRTDEDCGAAAATTAGRGLWDNSTSDRLSMAQGFLAPPRGRTAAATAAAAVSA